MNLKSTASQTTIFARDWRSKTHRRNRPMTEAHKRTTLAEKGIVHNKRPVGKC
jgi:hypothetical protein